MDKTIDRQVTELADWTRTVKEVPLQSGQRQAGADAPAVSMRE
jgi:hypothetical protein